MVTPSDSSLCHHSMHAHTFQKQNRFPQNKAKHNRLARTKPKPAARDDRERKLPPLFFPAHTRACAYARGSKSQSLRSIISLSAHRLSGGGVSSPTPSLVSVLGVHTPSARTTIALVSPKPFCCNSLITFSRKPSTTS